MKSLVLINPTYKEYLKSFAHWLQTLGYSKSTCYNLPNQLQGFFYFLEQRQLVAIDSVTPALVEAFFEELQSRSNARKLKIRGSSGLGKLSSAHLKKYVQALRKFSEYLQHTGYAYSFTVPSLKLVKMASNKTITFLAKTDIEALYAACSHDVLGIRDRAMLSLYYGCGLRRTEGEKLNLWDVKFKRKILYVMHSKNGEERGVPMAARGMDDLYNYVHNSRSQFQNARNNGALLLGMKGGRVSGQMLQLRLKALVLKAELFPEDQLVKIGLHRCLIVVCL